MSDQRTIGGQQRRSVGAATDVTAADQPDEGRRGNLVDHAARARLLRPNTPDDPWEGRLIRRTVVADGLAFVASGVIAWILVGDQVKEVVTLFGHHVPYLALGIVGLPAWIGVLALNHSYNRIMLGSSPDEYTSVIRAVMVLFTLICAAAFMGGMSISRGLFAVFFPLLLVLSLCARLIVRKGLHRRRGAGRELRRLVLVSRASAIVNINNHFLRSPHVGYQVVGAYLHGLRDRSAAPNGLDVSLLGEPDDLVRDLDDLAIDAVALSGGDLFEAESLRSLAWKLHDTGVQLLMAPDLAEIAGPRIVSRPAAGLPLLLVDEPHTRGTAYGIKSLVERTIALAICVALSPVLGLIALAIKCTSKGPVLFRQTRVMRAGEEFSMLKFRSMVVGAEDLLDELEDRNEFDGVLFKIRDDPRVTRVGRVLRKYSLDELPQLWNVVKGNMSLVGPRPPLPSEVARYEETTRRRLMVKPGITGLWQVSGRSDLSWEETVRLDLYYVENWSPLLDVIILAKTAKAVLTGGGAY